MSQTILNSWQKMEYCKWPNVNYDVGNEIICHTEVLKCNLCGNYNHAPY